MTEPVKLSVGDLVAFACRSGDLLFQAPPGPSAQEGIRAHQKLQRQRPAGSEAEYRLAVDVEEGGVTFSLGGRVDLLHPQTDLHSPPQLDEIKTTYCAPEKLSDSLRELHWTQLKIYGFCYALELREKLAQQAPDTFTLKMLWYNIKDKTLYPEAREYLVPELEAFARAALRIYADWHRQRQAHKLALVDSARQLDFPYPDYRAGQRDMAVSIYRSVRDGKFLTVEAPTGIGKTVSSLYPAIKAVGESELDTIVYLTAKNSGRQVVRETLEQMRGPGWKIAFLQIQARDKICPCRTGGCGLDVEGFATNGVATNGVCPRTVGFYDRLADARQALLARQWLVPETVAEVAEAFQLCPFELSLQMLPWADLVVCDFNYVFDPLVSLSHFQTGGDRRALLVDEAHNLGDRARQMHSVTLTKSDARYAAKACGSDCPSLKRSIESLARALERWGKQSGLSEAGQALVVASVEDPEARPQTVTRAAARVIEVLSILAEQGSSFPEAIGEWLKGIYRYLRIEALQGAQHRSLTRLLPSAGGSKRRDLELKLLCLNASEYLLERYAAFRAVIIFSATLRPAHYVYQQLGLNAQVPYLALPSPFDREQLGVFVCPQIDTRYRYRAEAIGPIVDIIARVRESRAGNYLVFFPSYKFLQQVADEFSRRYPSVTIVQQEPGADDQARETFREQFAEGRQSLGFAIMGGIFGEGVDYLGEQLIGALVIGVGLPQMNPEQELLRETSTADGFDIAYRYPGLTRVLQTAGRVIRSERDRGLLVLIDARFMQPFYRRLYPDNWQLQACPSEGVLTTSLADFWRRESAADVGN